MLMLCSGKTWTRTIAFCMLYQADYTFKSGKIIPIGIEYLNQDKCSFSCS